MWNLFFQSPSILSVNTKPDVGCFLSSISFSKGGDCNEDWDASITLDCAEVIGLALAFTSFTGPSISDDWTEVSKGLERFLEAFNCPSFAGGGT